MTTPEINQADIGWATSAAQHLCSLADRDAAIRLLADTFRRHRTQARDAALDEARSDTEIAAVVFRYIDRMQDVAPECGDPAERILGEFVRAMKPVLQRRLARSLKTSTTNTTGD